jgi:hypothetical protein
VSQSIGLSHFFQSGFRNCAQALFGEGVEDLNETIPTCAHLFATNAHGIELMVFDELCNLTHVLDLDDLNYL